MTVDATIIFIVVSNQSTVQTCIVYCCNAKPIFVYAICQPLNMLMCILNDIILKETRVLKWNNVLSIPHFVYRVYPRKIQYVFVTLAR